MTGKKKRWICKMQMYLVVFHSLLHPQHPGFLYFDDDKGFLSAAAMWGGDALKRLATAINPWKRQSRLASSVRFRNAVHDPWFNLSSASTTNVPDPLLHSSTDNVHYPFLNSSPRPKVIVVHSLLTDRQIVQPPIPAYAPVPVELVCCFLGYPVNKQSIDLFEIWMSFRMLFIEVGLDPEVQQFAGWMTFLWVFRFVGNLHAGPMVDHNVAGDMDHNAGGNVDLFGWVGWVAWLFGNGNGDVGALGNEAVVVMDGLVNQQDGQEAQDIIIVCLWLPLLALFIISYGYAFNTIVLSIFRIALGDWILATMPIWLRVLIFLFAVMSSISDEVYIALMWQIAGWAWNYIRNYVQNRVRSVYSSVFRRSTASRPPSITSEILVVIKYWRVQIDINARRLVQLLPQNVLGFLHLGSVTYVARVLLSYYVLAVFLLMFNVLFQPPHRRNSVAIRVRT